MCICPHVAELDRRRNEMCHYDCSEFKPRIISISRGPFILPSKQRAFPKSSPLLSLSPRQVFYFFSFLKLPIPLPQPTSEPVALFHTSLRKWKQQGTSTIHRHNLIWAYILYHPCLLGMNCISSKDNPSSWSLPWSLHADITPSPPLSLPHHQISLPTLYQST